MNNTSTENTSLKDASDSSTATYSKAEGIAWCSAFILTSLLVIVGNMLTIVLFVANKTLRKKSLYLVINMAFADLMLGALSLPGYIFYNGAENFHLWTGSMPEPLDFSHDIVDSFYMHASLISAAMISAERFFAVRFPYKQTASMRKYRIVISMCWILTTLVTGFEIGLSFLTSNEYATYVWIFFGLTVTFIICGCNLFIWRTFRQGGIAFQQQNRASRSKRLTKTLLFVSVLALMSWLPLIIMDALEHMFGVTIPAGNFYFTVTLINYCNSFVNPAVYVFRIPEFRQALASCCFKKEGLMSTESTERRRGRSTSSSDTHLRTLRVDSRHQSLLKQEFTSDDETAVWKQLPLQATEHHCFLNKGREIHAN